MAEFFKKVNPVFWFIIPPALFINFLAFYSPNILHVLPLVGSPIANFAIAHPQVLKATNAFAVVAHAGEGLYALALSIQIGNSFATSFKWFVQTFIMGFPSLRMLIAQKAKKGKGGKGKRN